MSRCFPFPPPCYEKNNNSDGSSLIFSIKIKKDPESPKEERRKERKREKKERKEKKSRKHGNVDGEKHSSHKRHKNQRSQVSDKAKRIEQESEHLENSGLTEEHGDYRHFSDSLDSIDDGSKRKKQKVDHNTSHNFGSGLCTRLPLQKPKAQSDSKIICQLERTETTTTTTTTTDPSSSLTNQSERQESSSRTLEMEIGLFRDLIENWVPSTQREYTEIDGQEWLFEKQQHHYKQDKRWKGGDEQSWKKADEQTGNGISGLWSCSACRLPDAGIYALPFTIPY